MSALQCLPQLCLKAKLFQCSKVHNTACCLDQTCKDSVPSCRLIGLSACCCPACSFYILSFCMMFCPADVFVDIMFRLIAC